MSEIQNNPNQEIDLGQLFHLIGKGIKAFFQLFVDLFQGVWNIVKHILLFFRVHLIKFIIAGAIGGVIGVGLDHTKEPEYEATMVVKPNFQSGRQLYKNVAYYEELVDQKQYDKLMEKFSISLEEAQNLVSFDISPVIMENYLVSSYDQFLKSIDSNLAQTITYDDFKDNFPDYSFDQHEIRVVSHQNDVFTKLAPSIVANVVSNQYFKKLEEAEKEIIGRNEVYLERSIQEVDTLRKVYKEVLLAEAKKVNSQGTNINMGAKEESNKELKLFIEENRINQELNELSRTKVAKSEILNVISDFQDVGFEVKGLSKKWSVKLPLFLMGLLLIGLISLKLDRYAIKN